MAIVWRGLTPRELGTWMRAMIASGDRLDLHAIRGRKVDKHSTGGVGDKVSICLAPLVAACGVPVPMMSRARRSATPAARSTSSRRSPVFATDSRPRSSARVLRDVRPGAHRPERATRPGRQAPVRAARRRPPRSSRSRSSSSSILSKKLAEGIDALRAGRQGRRRRVHAVDRRRAPPRAHAGARWARARGSRWSRCSPRWTSRWGARSATPTSCARRSRSSRAAGPSDTRALTVRFGAEMLVLGRAARDLADGTRRIEAAIASGAGLEKFGRCIELQGGDRRVLDRPRDRLPEARHRHVVVARRAGVVTAIDARAIGHAATLLGAGRLRKEDRVDPAVGITLAHKIGARVERRRAAGHDCTTTIAGASTARCRWSSARSSSPPAPRYRRRSRWCANGSRNDRRSPTARRAAASCATVAGRR